VKIFLFLFIFSLILIPTFCIDEEVDLGEDIDKVAGQNVPNLKDIPKDFKGARKWTREEYEKERGTIKSQEGVETPDVIMEYDYECTDGKCEYVSGLRVLVLGGTQFLGRLFIKHLLEDDLKSVTMLNRGNTENPFGEKVKHIKIDRYFDDPETLIEELKKMSYFDVVVDFTGLHGVHLLDIVKELMGKTSHYIYISCANVYYFDEFVGTGKLKERPLAHPEDESIEGIELQNPIGNELFVSSGKLSAETFLLDMYNKHAFPVTILRLPDVVGPYDNKGRHLGIQMALTRNLDLGTKVKHKNAETFSLIYAKDVITAINQTIKEKDKTFGKILNIAGDEDITIRGYAENIGNILKITPKFDNKKVALLPSILSGTLDNSLAKRILFNWTPTPIEQWLPELVSWYENQENMVYTANLIQRNVADAQNMKE